MSIDKIIVIALGGVILLLLACDNRTTESGTTEVTYTLDRHEPSAMFWDYAASASMLQSELGKLAKERAINPQLSALADSSLQMHAQGLKSLRAIAAKYTQVQLPDSLTGADIAIVEEFNLLEGEEFTTRYLDYLRSTNTTQLDRYQEELNITDDPALRSWLQAMNTQLRNQLQYIAATDTLSGNQ